MKNQELIIDDDDKLPDCPKGQEYALAFTGDNIAKIILEFLGNKQKFGFDIRRNFVLDRLNIANFDTILNEKIDKEAHATINYFSARILYNNGATREINNRDAIHSFVETKEVYPVSVTLNWNIVLKFPNNQQIENQKIELTFNTEENEDYGRIILNIQTTNYVWGTEVQQLFLDYTKEITLDIEKTRENI